MVEKESSVADYVDVCASVPNLGSSFTVPTEELTAFLGLFSCYYISCVIFVLCQKFFL